MRSATRVWFAGALTFHATAAKAEPIVAFVSQHNLTYAKAICDAIASETTASIDAQLQCSNVKDARDLGRSLEISVQSKFVTNLRCSNVRVIKGWDPSYDRGDGHELLALQNEEHWQLWLDFKPGSEKHSWSLFHVAPAAGADTELQIFGEGTPAQIANAVCIAVKAQGATH